MDHPTADRQRETLALSFEPAADGYVYYRNRWSRGIPVSAAEREAYLRIPALGSRRAWRESISGRQSVPPRTYGPVRRKILTVMPLKAALFGVVIGVVSLVSGFADLRSAHTMSDFFWLALHLVIAGIMLAFGLPIVISRFAHRGAD